MRLKYFFFALLSLGLAFVPYSFNACSPVERSRDRTLQGTSGGNPVVEIAYAPFVRPTALTELSFCVRDVKLQDSSGSVYPIHFTPKELAVVETGTSIGSFRVPRKTYVKAIVELDSICPSEKTVALTNASGGYETKESMTMTFQGNVQFLTSPLRLKLNIQKVVDGLAATASSSTIKPIVEGGSTTMTPQTTGWFPTSIEGAVGARVLHKSVWTGSEMIVWGGEDSVGSLNTGGRYDPATDTWAPMSTTNAPSPRVWHDMEWTGKELFVWGGQSKAGFDPEFNDGALYNPQTNSWRPVSSVNAPSKRQFPSVVWTGKHIIVWRGFDSKFGPGLSGKRYDPETDTWLDMSDVNSPPGRRFFEASMGHLVFAAGGAVAPAGIYNDLTDTWTVTSTVNQPYYRADACTVIINGGFAIWGGTSPEADGGIYYPATDTWVPIPPPSFAMNSQSGPGCVWTGKKLITSKGTDNIPDRGFMYDPITQVWEKLTEEFALPADQASSSTVWTGTEMIVWGGQDNSTADIHNTGVRYRPK